MLVRLYVLPIQLVRNFLFFIFKLIVTLRLFPALRERVLFEQKNFTCPYSRSFNDLDESADFAFEVSSEGELEQVLPIINSLINKRKKIELLICSPSVENRAKELCESNHEFLRFLRLPLTTYFFRTSSFLQSQNIKSWLTSKKLTLCRYDFFPELLEYGLNCEKFFLVNASLINSNENNFLFNAVKKLFQKKFYQIFDLVVVPGEADKIRFNSIYDKELIHCDLRVFQILDRLENTKDTILSKYPHYLDFVNYLENSNQTKIMIGSCWAEELELLKVPEIIDLIQQGVISLAISPHDLSQKNIDEFQRILSKLPLYIIPNQMSREEMAHILSLFEKNPGVILLLSKGVLCELYNYFDIAIVGGGFGSSVHSLLEPFLANCHVICGPATHRSTEAEYIYETNPVKLDVIKSLLSVPGIINKLNNTEKLENYSINEFKLNLQKLMVYY